MKVSSTTGNIGLSFIICTFNGSKTIIRSIESILNLKQYYPYEIIIVDNNSFDDTEQKVKKFLLDNSDKFQSSHRIILLKESKQGLIYARKKGVENSYYDYLCFIDDDNFLITEDWIKLVIETFNNHKNIGAIGGHSIPIFESTCPLWFERIKNAYAVGEQNISEGYLDYQKRKYLWGATLCIRKDILLQFFSKDDYHKITGRKGNKLSSGDDGIISLEVLNQGYHLYYMPQLKFYHFLKKERLEYTYALKLMFNIGYSNMKLSTLEKRNIYQQFKDFYFVFKNYILQTIKGDDFMREYYKGMLSFIFSFFNPKKQ